MKQFTKVALISLGLLILTTGAFALGAISGTLFGPDLLRPNVVRAADQPPEFEVFWQVWGLVEEHFVDQKSLSSREMTYGAVNGLIQSLGDDGHTRFLTPEEAQQQRTSISGKFFGIGARVGVEDGMTVIVAPLDNSPAYQAGIKSGDIILEVDHEDVTDLTMYEVVDLIRGEEGTEVVLTVFRPDTNESLEFPIIRDEIKVPAAEWVMVPGTDVAVIRLTQFSANITDNLTNSIREAEAAGATQLIIDVRNNPGGLLEQAVKVVSQFVTEGNALLQEDADGTRHPFPIESGGVAPKIPVAVLVNRGSASAAEIFAGAIQDHNRGIVIGETTFGTGTVLQPFQLDDGSALLLGTSQWLTPEGRLIRKQGIEPDVIIELPVGADLLSKTELEELTYTELLESEDTQLLKALEELGAIPPQAEQESSSPLQIVK